MNRKSADIEEVLQTFSAHVKDNYPQPAMFRENLEKLLEAKKRRMKEAEYLASLERNMVFLHDLAIETEALLESLLEGINERDDLSSVIEEMLQEIEAGVRKVAGERWGQVFRDGRDGDFGELRGLRGGDAAEYASRLEFEYKYLMTFRMMLFEFFGLLAAVNGEYEIERVDEAAPRHILNHIGMTANYYLGNITVGEVVTEGKEAGGTEASS